MRKVTDENVIDKIKSAGRTFECEIKVGKNTYTEIKKLTFKKPFSSNNKISIGDALSGYIEAEILNCPTPLTHERIKVSLFLLLDELDENGKNKRYEFPLGYFTVQEPCEIDGFGTQKIVAYDDILKTDGVGYIPLNNGNVTFDNILKNIGKICDIDISDNAIIYAQGLNELRMEEDDGTIHAFVPNEDFLIGHSCREVLGSIAAIEGKQCICNYGGEIDFAGFLGVNVNTYKGDIQLDEIDTFDFPVKQSEINRLICTAQEGIDVEYGNNRKVSSGIKYNNILLSTLWNANEASIWNERLFLLLTSIFYNRDTDLEGNIDWTMRYYPASFKQLSGDPRIEVGDIIQVQNRYYNSETGEYENRYSQVPVMNLEMEYDGGLSLKIGSYEANTDLKDSTDQGVTALSTRVSALEGSGWETLSLTSAVTNSIVTPKCCLRGEVVYVTGRVEVKMSSATDGKVTIAKLPSGYRPKSNGLYKFVCASGKTLSRINIKPDVDTNAGDIVLEFVHNVASNKTIVNDTVSWVDLNFNFAI